MISFHRGSGGDDPVEGSTISFLFDAAITGDAEKVAQILEQNAGALDLEAKQGDGKTALHLAAERGNGEVVMILLNRGVYVDTKEQFTGRTALHLAAHNGHTDAAKILLENGATVEALDSMARTPLHEATQQDGLLVMQMLLNAGSYVDPRDALDSTPLMDAAGRGHVEMVRVLLENGADVNGGMRDHCETPLIVACERHGGYADVARILLEAGATVERRDAVGSTALQYAAHGGNLELVQLLLEYAADPASLQESAGDEDVEASPPSQLQESLQSLPEQVEFGGSEKRRFRRLGESRGDVLAASSTETLSSLATHVRPRRAWQFWRSRRRSGPSRQTTGAGSQYTFRHARDSNIQYESRHSSDSDSHVDEDGMRRRRNPHRVHRFPRTGTVDGGTLNEAVKKLLETPQKQKGPSIRGLSGRRAPSRLRTSFVTPPRRFEIAKRKACDGHHVSMMQFYVGGVQEQRLPVQASVHEVLYGKGPSVLLQEARDAVEMTERADFTWFHIPANNLTWAEHLITRLRDERREDMEGQYGTARKKWRCMDDMTRAALNLAQPQQGKGVSFLKTQSNVAEIPTSDESATEHSVMLVLPYLHYESCASFGAMTKTIDEMKDEDENMNQAMGPFMFWKTKAGPALDGKWRMVDGAAGMLDTELQRDVSLDRQSVKPMPLFDVDVMEEELEFARASQRAHRESGGVSKSQHSLAGAEAQMRKAWSTGYTPSDMSNERTSHRTFPQRIQRRYIKRPLDPTTARALPFGVYGQDVSSKPPMQLRPRRPHLYPNPNWSLLRGYFAEGIQPRRSLDQYRYTDTRHRDSDQVVTRHCAKHHQPLKLFVVDQLWLWVLGSHTLITCAASPWDPREVARETAYLRDVVTGRPMREAMHVQKAVVNYLSRTQRRPVMDVHALANVVVQHCVGMFHHGGVPRSLQFFDFFEESVASLMDDVAMCLKDIRNQYNAMHPATIGKEMESLIEVADILDELDILREVLKEQLSTVLKYNKQILTHLPAVENSASMENASTIAAPTEAAISHIARIDAMEAQAKKAQDMLFRITDLKQKHNGQMEALAAGEQAKATAKQSNAVMLFTVITIIFLPISFMAAFFAIPADGFTINADGKLPLNYVIKYMVSVGLALSVPFILIAFNLDKAAAALKYIRPASGTPGRHNERNLKEKKLQLWQYIPFYWYYIRSFIFLLLLAVATAVILAPIWTSHLALKVKLAVTITIAVLAVLGTLGVAFLHCWRRGFGWSSDKYSSSGDSTLDSALD